MNTGCWRKNHSGGQKERELTEVVRKDGIWMKLAQDRVQWRALLLEFRVILSES
jgi:hypothetical protein